MKRLRKSVCIILLMAILCSILPNTASAYTEKYWWWSDKEMLIEPDSIKDGYIVKDGVLISYEGTDTELVVPEGIIEIASWVFQHNDNYKSITLPYSLKKIGPYNFYYCKNLEKVVFEEEVGEIDHDCFYGNDNLKEVVVPEKIEKIGNDCFRNNKNLKEVYLSEKVKDIGTDCFKYNNDKFGIKCNKGSVPYQYAIENNISFSKLYGIEYRVSAYAGLSEVLDVKSQNKLKGKGITLKITVGNYEEYGYIYDEEDKKKMLLKNPKVTVELPSALKFSDGSYKKTISFKDVSVGDSNSVKENVKLISYFKDNEPLTAKITVESGSYIKTFSSNLASFGLTAPNATENKYAAKIKHYKVPLDEQINTTICLSGVNGKISETAEYKINDDYYVFYKSVENKHWKLHCLIFDKQFKVKTKLSFPYIKNYEKFGNAIVDAKGNFYIICGHDDEAGKEENDTKVLAIVKFNSDVKEIARKEFMSKETGEDLSGTRFPFNGGECAVTIDDKGRLFCNYARAMYNGHQSNNVLAIDTNTMESLEINWPYCSHSFEQQVYSFGEDGVLFINHGDAFPRALQVSLIKEDLMKNYTYDIFHYRNSTWSYNQTFSNFGGVADLKKGFLMTGCSERKLSYEKQKNGTVEERNVYLQMIDKDMQNGTSGKSIQLFDTEPRYAEGTFNYDNYYNATFDDHNVKDYLPQNTIDYGVLWLTNYKGAEYASASKIVKLTDSTAAVFWEKRKYIPKDDDYEYVGTYYCIVDDNGNIVQGETEIQNARLSNFDNMIYDGENIIWTTKPSYLTKALMVHVLQVGKFEEKTVDLESDDFFIKDGVLLSVSKSLTNVEIPDIVKEIDAFTFKGCKNIKQVTIPNSVKKIGDYAFKNCENIKQITIPGSVKKIGKYAFKNCKKLEKIEFEEGIQEIGDYAFWACESVKQVTIPGSVKKIGRSAFCRCKKVEKFKIKKGLQEIKDYAFCDFENIKQLIIPESVKKIGKYAFRNCKELEKIELKEGLQEIGECAFEKCKNIKQIIIPDSVKKIENGAFYGCKNIKEVIIPKNTKNIGSWAFPYSTKVVYKSKKK